MSWQSRRAGFQRAGAGASPGRRLVLSFALLMALLPCCAAQLPAPAPSSGSGTEPPALTAPVVLLFDDFNQVMVGSGTRTGMLDRRPIDVLGRVGEVRCIGAAEIRILPPGAVPGERCDGMRGDAMITCSDEREIAFKWWPDESCASGYGEGLDREGHRVHLVFGGSQQRAEAIAVEALAELAAKPPLPAVGSDAESQRGGISTGTAFFVSWEGHLVTNHHVIDGASRIQAVLDDGELVDAELVASDEENDLALLRVEALRTPLPLRRDPQLARGQEVFTLGFPLVQLQGQEQKATFGRVNALSGIQGDQRFVQIDVPIQPGNSGGPLINRDGEVVGVVSAMLHQLVTLKLAGVVPQNVNYAIKSDLAHRLLRRRLGAEWGGAESSEAGREFSDLVEQLESSVVLVVAD